MLLNCRNRSQQIRGYGSGSPKADKSRNVTTINAFANLFNHTPGFSSFPAQSHTVRYHPEAPNQKPKSIYRRFDEDSFQLQKKGLRRPGVGQVPRRGW